MTPAVLRDHSLSLVRGVFLVQAGEGTLSEEEGVLIERAPRHAVDHYGALDM